MSVHIDRCIVVLGDLGRLCVLEDRLPEAVVYFKARYERHEQNKRRLEELWGGKGKIPAEAKSECGFFWRPTRTLSPHITVALKNAEPQRRASHMSGHGYTQGTTNYNTVNVDSNKSVKPDAMITKFIVVAEKS